MTLHSYLLFVTASIVLVLVPGPDMIYMLGRCIAQGRKAGLMAAMGFNLGGYSHLTAAALGLSAVLATSAVAFTAVKWLGAGYLIYLGISTLRSKTGLIELDTTRSSRSAKTILWQAFLSNVLNPKVAMFFSGATATVYQSAWPASDAADTDSRGDSERHCTRG